MRIEVEYPYKIVGDLPEGTIFTPEDTDMVLMTTSKRDVERKWVECITMGTLVGEPTNVGQHTLIPWDAVTRRIWSNATLLLEGM